MDQKMCVKCKGAIEAETLKLHSILVQRSSKKTNDDGTPFRCCLCFVCLQAGLREMAEEDVVE